MTLDLRTRDLLGRIGIISFFTWRSGEFVAESIRTGRLAGLLFLVFALVVIVCMIVRRPATRVESSWSGRVVALIGTFGGVAFTPGGVAVGPPVAAGLLMLLGLGLAISALTCLGKNFGVVAAVRGVSDYGPYRLVRHPTYLGYALMHAGFLVANWSAWNATVWVIVESAQIGRTLYEERVLRHDPQYARYMQQVSWRLVPGVF